MKNENQMQMMITYMSLMASATSILIFGFIFSGKLSRDMVLSIAGISLGMLMSITGIYLYAMIKRGTIRAFISYANVDSEAVKSIRKYLSVSGIVVVEAEATVRIGDDIARAIDNAVQSSDCIILILSQRAVASDWVKREIEKAKQTGKRLYPVRIDDVDPPKEIETIRYADLQKDVAGELKKLVIAIRENHGRQAIKKTEVKRIES